jgi:hypothetical protein
MFASGYEDSPVSRKRLLQSFGRPRGVVLLPRPGSLSRRVETVHSHSAMMVSPVPGKLMVVEWTEDVVELHEIDF